MQSLMIVKKYLSKRSISVTNQAKNQTFYFLILRKNCSLKSRDVQNFRLFWFSEFCSWFMTYIIFKFVLNMKAFHKLILWMKFFLCVSWTLLICVILWLEFYFLLLFVHINLAFRSFFCYIYILNIITTAKKAINVKQKSSAAGSPK